MSDIDRLSVKRFLSLSTRIFVAVALVGVLLAACGDDDDDDDIEGGDVTEPTAITTPPAGDTTEEEDGTTATEAEVEEDGTEAEGTEAEDEAGTPGEIAGTPTEEDMDATEDEADSTEPEGTEPEGTEPEGTAAEDDMTPTEDDDVEATEPEGDDGATPTEDMAEGTEPEGEAGTASIGETVEVGDLAVTVEAAEEFTSTSGIVEPESGMTFMAVEVTIENMGSDPLSLIDILSQLRLEDATGEEFDADLLANAALLLEGQGVIDSRLEPGSEVSGTIGFQVPEDAEGLMLVIEADNGESIEIELDDES